jgi:hypothetical protein
MTKAKFLETWLRAVPEEARVEFRRDLDDLLEMEKETVAWHMMVESGEGQ